VRSGWEAVKLEVSEGKEALKVPQWILEKKPTWEL
jgi:hypothetical protein